MNELEQRFWDKVDMTEGPDGCWPWMAATNRAGYGRFGVSKPKRILYAHRVAHALHVGIDILDLPDAEVVMHECDNPPCCNPAHLREGTQADNLGDMVKRRRSARGENSSGARLTENDVQEIRDRLRLGHVQHEIAADFDISQVSVSHIATGKTWSSP